MKDKIYGTCVGAMIGAAISTAFVSSVTDNIVWLIGIGTGLGLGGLFGYRNIT